jgi:hypothetical protein
MWELIYKDQRSIEPEQIIVSRGYKVCWKGKWLRKRVAFRQQPKYPADSSRMYKLLAERTNCLESMVLLVGECSVVGWVMGSGWLLRSLSAAAWHCFPNKWLLPRCEALQTFFPIINSIRPMAGVQSVGGVTPSTNPLESAPAASAECSQRGLRLLSLGSCRIVNCYHQQWAKFTQTAVAFEEYPSCTYLKSLSSD